MSREEVIRILKLSIENSRNHVRFCFDNKGITALDMAIQALEQTQWIPVSERLPEKDKYTEFYECLVAVPYTSRHNVCKTVSAYFNGKHFYRNRFDRAFISEVKAWMPLPESYKGE